MIRSSVDYMKKGRPYVLLSENSSDVGFVGVKLSNSKKLTRLLRRCGTASSGRGLPVKMVRNLLRFSPVDSKEQLVGFRTVACRR